MSRAATYEPHDPALGQGPAWPWWTGAGLLWLGAGVLLVALGGAVLAPGHPHPLGPAGDSLAKGLSGAWGAAAWVPAAFLALGGWVLAAVRRADPLGPLLVGGLWATLGLAVLLGPSGGSGGQAMTSALTNLGGEPLARGAAGLLLAAGAGLAGWTTWRLWWPVVLAALPGVGGGAGEEAAPAETSRSATAQATAEAPEEREGPAITWDEPVTQAESAPGPALDSEPPAPEPTPPPPPPAAPAPVDPTLADNGGLLIKPRAAAVPEAKAQQDKLAFAQGPFKLPGLGLLQDPPDQSAPERREVLISNSRLLEEKLADFGVQGNVREVAPGPVVTLYEFKPAPGVKISKVAGLADDLAMNLKAPSIRIVAPIPGKAAIGIEIPSEARETVYLREILASAAYAQERSPLTVAMGKDTLGAPVVADLTRMPHLLIAGATGAGKSVFINTLVLSILYKAPPETVRLLMIDPKRIELSTYNDVPHLLYPIITDPKDATGGLRWAVREMERRYELLARHGVRNIRTYNQKAEKQAAAPVGPDEELLERLPYVVIIIDELADLMMVASKEVESLITRLAQMARAAGLHLVLATQRPSVDVITGLIKANFPARVSFKVSSRADSRVILDAQGAEHLLGLGDMLFNPPGAMGQRRVHGAYVSDSEIERVVDYLKEQGRPDYDESVVAEAEGEGGGGLDGEGETDERYFDAVALVKASGQASISSLQRHLRVGYNRAARMIEQMEREGIVGPSDGSRPREVLVRD